VGWTTALPDLPDTANPWPVQDEACLELQVSVEDWPTLIFFGEAERETVVVGGGGVKISATHAV